MSSPPQSASPAMPRSLEESVEGPQQVQLSSPTSALKAVAEATISNSRPRSQSDGFDDPFLSKKLENQTASASTLDDLNDQLTKARQALEAQATTEQPRTSATLPLTSVPQLAIGRSPPAPGQRPTRVTSLGHLSRLPESGVAETSQSSPALEPSSPQQRQRSKTSHDCKLSIQIITQVGGGTRNHYSLGALKTKWIISGDSPRSSSSRRSCASSSVLDSSRSNHSFAQLDWQESGSPSRSRTHSEEVGSISVPSLASAFSPARRGRLPSGALRARQDSGSFSVHSFSQRQQSATAALGAPEWRANAAPATTRTHSQPPPLAPSASTLPPRPALPMTKSMSVLPSTGSSISLLNLSPPRKRAITDMTAGHTAVPQPQGPRCSHPLPSAKLASPLQPTTTRDGGSLAESDSDDEVPPSAVASALQYYRTSPSRPPSYDIAQRLPCELCGALVLRWAILLPCGHRACTACCCSGVNQVSTTPPREHTCAACGQLVEGISLSLPAAEAARAAAMPAQQQGRSVFSLPSNEGDRASPRRQREKSSETRRFPGVTEALLGLDKPLPAEMASKTLTQVAEEFQVDKYMAASALTTPPRAGQHRPLSVSPETTFNTDESFVLSEHASFYKPKHVGQAALHVGNDAVKRGKPPLPAQGISTNLSQAAAVPFFPTASSTSDLFSASGENEPYAVVRMDNIPWRTSYQDVIQWIPEADTLLPNATALPQPVHVPLDLRTGKTANSAFIELRNADAAKKLIRKRNNTKLMGRPVSLLLSSYDELLAELFPVREPLPPGVSYQHAAYWTPWQLDQLLHLMDFGAPQLKSPIKPIELTISLVELAPAELPYEHKLLLAERTLEVYCQGTQWLANAVEGLSDALDRLVLAIASCAVLSVDLKDKLLEYIRHLSSKSNQTQKVNTLLGPQAQASYYQQQYAIGTEHGGAHEYGYNPSAQPLSAPNASASREALWPPPPESTTTDSGHFGYTLHQQYTQQRSAPATTGRSPYYYSDGSMSATMARQDEQLGLSRYPYQQTYTQPPGADYEYGDYEYDAFSPIVNQGHLSSDSAHALPLTGHVGPVDPQSTSSTHFSQHSQHHDESLSRRGSYSERVRQGTNHYSATSTAFSAHSANPWKSMYGETHFEHLVNSVAS